ncbi:MAG: 23S rRNA (guanosine-2'-O-)-methyltransferase RlmB [Wolbachia endosymbiont of Ctenocephalides orientis wCori]|nr:MAG: 23S rRNA (guanosine-2'-O-)-methyltransferase RlmB [Wolbachia endosymbiont of Ctenocephalides orientis wCori]
MKLSKNNENFWLYGKHTCVSALKNENRKCIELLVTENSYNEFEKEITECAKNRSIKAKIVENKTLNNTLPKDCNHQGIALKVAPISNRFSIEDIVKNGAENSTIVILDQITDTNNIGSILRTSACFNVDALILPNDHSSSENASIAKAASGALEIVPLIYVTNIVNTMKYLKENDYWFYGLDCSAKENMHAVKIFGQKRVIILGSEEKGMRRLVKENCDHLLKIPMSNAIDSLNVSNAAAIVLHFVYINMINQ